MFLFEPTQYKDGLNLLNVCAANIDGYDNVNGDEDEYALKK